MDLGEALAHIDHWCINARTVKIVILTGLGLVEDHGWGGVGTDGLAKLRIVYVRDDDETEVDTVVDVSGSAVSASNIWDATALQQEKYVEFDDVLGFSLLDGRTVLLMCATLGSQDEN